MNNVPILRQPSSFTLGPAESLDRCIRRTETQRRLVGGVIRGRWVRVPDGLRGFGGGPANCRRRSPAIFVSRTSLEGLKNDEIIVDSHDIECSYK